MERNNNNIPSSSPRSKVEGGLLSCWGCLKFKLPWRKRSAGAAYKSVGGFRYDPLSYAQNFDEGCVEDDEESLRRGFSARYAAPSMSSSPVQASKSMHLKLRSLSELKTYRL
ncbi:hypothetical protein PIB30_004245 [Stylosanthes scabra]|uniref:Uncharacterized protein n=1 Tax=Stylosanthes scabra TaxID=79078 RepID=A0ABU6S444_9FABA|nr:hypothetical protein [Stylosanthes scabra]